MSTPLKPWNGLQKIKEKSDILKYFDGNDKNLFYCKGVK